MREEETDDRLARLKEVHAFLAPRLERAEKLYAQILTSLWAANGVGITVLLGFITTLWRHPDVRPRYLLYPVASFGAGLICMAIGALLALIKDWRLVRRAQGASSWLDLPVDAFESPAAARGLVLSDWRNRMAILAFLFFVVGCVATISWLIREVP